MPATPRRLPDRLLLSMLLGRSRPPRERKPPAIVSQAIDGFIRPGYQRFSAAPPTRSHDKRRQALCAAPSRDALDGARKRFRRHGRRLVARSRSSASAR